jgi:hypothetical protein
MNRHKNAFTHWDQSEEKTEWNSEKFIKTSPKVTDKNVKEITKKCDILGYNELFSLAYISCTKGCHGHISIHAYIDKIHTSTPPLITTAPFLKQLQ